VLEWNGIATSRTNPCSIRSHRRVWSSHSPSSGVNAVNGGYGRTPALSRRVGASAEAAAIARPPRTSATCVRCRQRRRDNAIAAMCRSRHITRGDPRRRMRGCHRSCGGSAMIQVVQATVPRPTVLPARLESGGSGSSLPPARPEAHHQWGKVTPFSIETPTTRPRAASCADEQSARLSLVKTGSVTSRLDSTDVSSFYATASPTSS
jgi:hypothetical protein